MSRVIDGRSLDPAGLSELARHGARDTIDRSLIERATRPFEPAGPAYGRTTGVGANRTVDVEVGSEGHDLRLWSSHAAGAGPLLDEDAVRAMLVVRLNQICAGPTGVSSTCAVAVATALADGLLPAIHRYGAVGTGDLTALAALGLCLAGRRPWWRGEAAAPSSLVPAAGDGLALLSSNALTVGVAALAAHDLDVLCRAGVVVAALGGLALGAAPEAFSSAVWPATRPARVPDQANPEPGAGTTGASWVAAVLATALVGAGRRLQDPYPLRAAPAWHGPVVTALAELGGEVTAEMNRSRENPRPDPTSGRWLHHASIVATGLTARLDAVRAALVPAANGSLSRTRLLHSGEDTGLRPFLATGAAGSSGTMVCEYTASAALAELRQRALPAAIGWATLSLGQEDGAPFTTQSAFDARDAVPAYRAVLAAELVVAGRALRLGGWPRERLRDRASPWLAVVLGEVLAALPAEAEDHDLGPDLEAAAQLLPSLAEASAEASSHR